MLVASWQSILLQQKNIIQVYDLLVVAGKWLLVCMYSSQILRNITIQLKLYWKVVERTNNNYNGTFYKDLPDLFFQNI